MFLPAKQLLFGRRDSGVGTAGEGGRFFRSAGKGRSGGAGEFGSGGKCIGRDSLRRADLEILISVFWVKSEGRQLPYIVDINTLSINCHDNLSGAGPLAFFGALDRRSEARPVRPAFSVFCAQRLRQREDGVRGRKRD